MMIGGVRRQGLELRRAAATFPARLPVTIRVRHPAPTSLKVTAMHADAVVRPLALRRFRSPTGLLIATPPARAHAVHPLRRPANAGTWPTRLVILSRIQDLRQEGTGW